MTSAWAQAVGRAHANEFSPLGQVTGGKEKTTAKSAGVEKTVTGTAQPGLPADYGNPPHPGMSAATAAQAAGAGSHLAIPSITVEKNLGKELIGMGPGLGELAYGTGKDIKKSIETGKVSLPTLKAAGEAQIHSFGQTIHHPLKQLENDPLGLLVNAGSIFALPGSVIGRASAMKEASGVGATAKALVKTPQPPLRTIKTPGGDLHPITSKSYSIGMIQRHVIDPIRQSMLDKNQDSIVGGKIMGPQVSVGREMRATEQVRTALQGSEGATLKKYGATAPSKAAKIVGRDTGSILKGKTKLSAAQQKAVQITASGRPFEEHAQLEANAITHLTQNVIPALKVKIAQAKNGRNLRRQLRTAQEHVKAHELQQSLTVAAGKHMGSALVKQAALAASKAIERREEIRGMTEDETLHRLGAHASQIEHLAKDDGFGSESPIEALGRIESEGNASPEELAAAHQAIIAKGREAQTNGAFYLPMQGELRKVTRGGMTHVRASVGDYGIGPGRKEANHPYGGKLLRTGAYRTDMTNLAARALHDANREASAQRIHAALYKQAADEPFPGSIPIRKSSTTPPELKRQVNAIDRGEIRGGEYHEPFLSQLVKSWFDPNAAAPGEGIRYIARNRVGPLSPYVPQLGPLGERIDRLNQIPRMGRYLTPAYLKWLPQNLVFAGVHQGPFIIRNAKTLFSTVRELSPEDYDKLTELSGQPLSMGLAGDTPIGRAATMKLAAFWTHVTDHMARMLTILHELHNEGIRTADQMHVALNAPIGSALETKTIMAGRRANQAAGRYVLTNTERATLKKLIPIWPWIHAATHWTVSLFRDHPYQSLVYGSQGSQGVKEVEAFYNAVGGHVPANLESSIPTSMGALDTSVLSAAETPGALLEDASGLIPGVPSEYRGELMGDLGGVVASGISELQGLTKYGGTDRKGEAPIQQLENSFAPYGDIKLAENASTTKSTEGGPAAALFRITGIPLSPTNYAVAGKQGLTDLKAKGLPQDAATAELAANRGAIANALKTGEIDESGVHRLWRAAIYQSRQTVIANGTAQTKLSKSQDRRIAIAQAAFEREGLDSLNATLRLFKLPPATQAELAAEAKHY